MVFGARKEARISSQKIHLVTGKGGVGKSTVAAALALKCSKVNGKTLLVELGDRGFYSHVWGRAFGFKEVQVDSQLWVARWSGEDSLREYVGHLIRVQRLVDLIFENRIMKALVRAAPALNELAILGKLTSGIRKIGPAFDFENVIVDAYATGHFKALINAPKGMSEAIPRGPMGDQSRAMAEILRDSKRVKIYVVALPEELPVNESMELADSLERGLGQTPKFILNKCLDPGVSESGLQELLKEKQDSRLSSYLVKGMKQQREFAQVFQQSSRTTVLNHLWLPTSVELYRQLSLKIPEDFCD